MLFLQFSSNQSDFFVTGEIFECVSYKDFKWKMDFTNGSEWAILNELTKWPKLYFCLEFSKFGQNSPTIKYNLAFHLTFERLNLSIYLSIYYSRPGQKGFESKNIGKIMDYRL